MKKGKTILFSILSLFLISAIFVVGVFALTDKKDLKMNNSFFFNPGEQVKEMKFNLRGEVSNAKETDITDEVWQAGGYENKAEYIKNNNLSYDATYDNTTAEFNNETALPTWEIGDLNFINHETSIKYTFYITNLSSVTSINVKMTPKQDAAQPVTNTIYIADAETPESKFVGDNMIIPR